MLNLSQGFFPLFYSKSTRRRRFISFQPAITVRMISMHIQACRVTCARHFSSLARLNVITATDEIVDGGVLRECLLHVIGDPSLLW